MHCGAFLVGNQLCHLGSSDAVGLGVVVFAMCIGQEKMATRPEPMKEAVVTCLSWACWLWGLVLYLFKVSFLMVEKAVFMVILVFGSCYEVFLVDK